jgi:hypothetical protein
VTEIGSVASEGSGAVTGGTGTWYKKAAFDEAACALAAVQPKVERAMGTAATA